jgi:hypothetical protein
LLLFNLPGPRASSSPARLEPEALSPLQLREIFTGDDEVDLLAEEWAEELAEEIEEMPRFDQPAEAVQFYIEQRVPPDETTLPVERYGIALRQMEDMPQYSTKEGRLLPSRRQMKEQGINPQSIGTWQNLGPGNIGGRTRGLVIDPTNPNLMYAGGGRWRDLEIQRCWDDLDSPDRLIAEYRYCFPGDGPN